MVFNFEYLNECFILDPLEGLLTWKLRPLAHFADRRGWARFNKHLAGARAGHPDRHGYLRVRLDQHGVFVHRIVYQMHRRLKGHDMPPLLDHINGTKNDNRPRNLRPATCAENQQNRHGLQKNNRSGRTGVCRALDGRYKAQMRFNGAVVLNAHFANFDDAVQARRDAEKIYF